MRQQKDSFIHVVHRMDRTELFKTMCNVLNIRPLLASNWSHASERRQQAAPVLRTRCIERQTWPAVVPVPVALGCVWTAVLPEGRCISGHRRWALQAIFATFHASHCYVNSTMRFFMP